MRWASDLTFVGHHEPRTEKFIAALLDAGLQVSIYGHGWEPPAEFGLRP